MPMNKYKLADLQNEAKKKKYKYFNEWKSKDKKSIVR